MNKQRKVEDYEKNIAMVCLSNVRGISVTIEGSAARITSEQYSEAVQHFEDISSESSKP